MSTEQEKSWLSKRGGGNVWARSENFVKSVLRGNPEDVMPISMEYMPILTCNASCPGCPFGTPRKVSRARRVELGALAISNDVTAGTLETAQLVLEKAREAGVLGVLFTGGGEPTIWDPLVTALQFSRQIGMTNGLYSNGFRLGLVDTLAEQLMHPDAGLAFIRISVNTCSELATTVHWGIPNPRVALNLQRLGIERLLACREKFDSWYDRIGTSVPSISISTIVNNETIADLLGVCSLVHEIFRRHSDVRGIEDVMVVRPMTNHKADGYSDADHDEEMISEIIRICGKDGPGRRLVEDVGLGMNLGFGLTDLDSGVAETYGEVIRRQYSTRDRSWSSGLFLTVGPDGSVYPCTEKSCHSEWTIGDLKTSSVAEIYKSTKRLAFLKEADRINWGPEIFQPFGRMQRIDEIAKAILSGDMSDDDIEFVRMASYESHTLLMN